MGNVKVLLPPLSAINGVLRYLVATVFLKDFPEYLNFKLNQRNTISIRHELQMGWRYNNNNLLPALQTVDCNYCNPKEFNFTLQMSKFPSQFLATYWESGGLISWLITISALNLRLHGPNSYIGWNCVFILEKKIILMALYSLQVLFLAGLGCWGTWLLRPAQYCVAIPRGQVLFYLLEGFSETLRSLTKLLFVTWQLYRIIPDYTWLYLIIII